MDLFPAFIKLAGRRVVVIGGGPVAASKLEAFSFRIPTAVVAAADLTIRLTNTPTTEDIRCSLEDLSAASAVVDINQESLVASDYLGSTASVTLDLQWLKLTNDVKIVAWYDNEWGYSARVVDAVLHVGMNL